MKIKKYMKPYTCGELQKNLQRDKRKLADLEKRYSEELKDGRETLVNGTYDCYGSEFAQWKQELNTGRVV